MRIRDLDTKTGAATEDISERWIRAAVMRNLPDSVLKIHAVELKKAESVEEMHSIINTYQFDHKTGLPRGQQGPGLYYTAADNKEEDKTTKETSHITSETNNVNAANGTQTGATENGDGGDVCAVPKRGKKGKEGKGSLLLSYQESPVGRPSIPFPLVARSKAGLLWL